MPDELEQRIERALRADVADLPMAIVPSMVEDRIDQTVGSGISLPLVGGAIAAAVLLVVVASAWLPGRQPSSPPGASADSPTAISLWIVNCPIAQPGPAPAEIGDQLFGSGSAWGNEDLWVGGLGDGGVIDARPVLVADDGSISWKLGWWRDVSGTLAISGRRLDADAPPLGASVPDGYGSIGFQASDVSFPTEGCWEVTGRVGEAQLTFVTYVIDLRAEVDTLFSDTRECELTLAGVDLEVTYPATWFPREPAADQQGCTRFSWEPIETGDASSSGFEGIILGAVGGPEGPRQQSEEELVRQHRRVADLQAMRVEVLDSETGVRRLTYWIAAGPDADGGPTIVAATFSDAAGSYVLNRAVLDRMMEELTANPPPAPSAQVAATPSATPTASVESSEVPIPAEFTERAELPSCGHEVVERTPEGDFHDAEATACFLAAYEAGEPAEFISESVTVEGGRTTTVFRVLGPGQIELFRDSTQDPLSIAAWTRTMCNSILEIARDPNGVPILIGDKCDDPVLLSE